MSSDRELLELAAKAAGVDARRLPDSWPVRFDDDQWNPLIDDGDALRLAVKLELIVGHDAYDKLAYAQIREPHFSANNFYGGTTQTPEAATRRAIVRAAASIAKGSEP